MYTGVVTQLCIKWNGYTTGTNFNNLHEQKKESGCSSFGYGL
jgi:hypothetical protein